MDNPRIPQDEAIELERYELDEPPPYRFDFTRRHFVKLFGTGIAVVLAAPDASSQETGGPGSDEPAETDRVSAWLHLDEQGKITVYTGKVEVGQNIRTSLSQAVAEELRVGLDDITMVMGDTDRVPYDRGTFGSQTTPKMAPAVAKSLGGRPGDATRPRLRADENRPDESVRSLRQRR